MARIGVDSEDLRQHSSVVTTGANQVSEILTRLTGQIQDLAARWEGAASEAFQGRWHDWQQGATQIQQAMDEMGTFLAQAAEAYEATEDGLRSASGR